MKDLQDFVRGQVSSKDLLEVVSEEKLQEIANRVIGFIEEKDYTVLNLDLNKTSRSGEISFQITGEAYVNLSVASGQVIGEFHTSSVQSDFRMEFVDNYEELAQKIIQKL